MNPKDGFVLGNCKDIQAKQVLEFLVPILYPEKPTHITVVVGNTIFGELLEERSVNWGLLLYDVVGRMVALVGKGKPTMVCSYIFHLDYKEYQVLLSLELMMYMLGMEMVKYNCISDPESTPTASKSETKPHQDTSTSEGRIKRKMSSNKRADSSPHTESQSREAGSSQSEVVKNAQAFDKAIKWNKMARGNFDALGKIVKDVAQVLGNVDIRDFNKTLESIPKPKDIAEKDNHI